MHAAGRPGLISPTQTSPELCLLLGSRRAGDWSRECGRDGAYHRASVVLRASLG